MGKKRKNDPEAVFRNFDPAIDKLASERFFSGKQLFDYKTHKLRRGIRDEAQARAILLRAQQLADQMDKKLVLRYFEQRLLEKVLQDKDRHEPSGQ
jgi:hypothetical protein